MIFIALLKAGNIFKLVQVMLLSGIKFIFAPLLSLGLGFNWIETIVVTTIGGILGVFFFFYLSKLIILFFKKLTPIVKRFFKKTISFFKKESLEVQSIKNSSTKKVFTKKNKLILKTKKKFGLLGISVLTPVLLSIPLGTFLANKYYKNKKKVLFSLSVSVVCWSLIFSSIYFLF